MQHYCTCFDSGFLPQGLALWESLNRHEPGTVLWVLACDDAVAAAVRARAEPNLRVVTLPEVEAGDPALAAAKVSRSRVEYFFTLSPCWPLWLLRHQPDLSGITSLDADLYFFAAPQPLFAEIAAAGASVGIVEHRYPPALRELAEWGRFNVGIQYFRNDTRGLAVLADWRTHCLEWCYDRLESDRFADQKYLDAWPERFGPAVHVVAHPGINVAPWNWSGVAWSTRDGRLLVDGHPLVVFHFAKFRPCGPGFWDSGQLEFAVMPRGLRTAVYEPYWQALHATGRTSGRSVRGRRLGLKGWLLRGLFGSVWWRAGGAWLALGFGPLGRRSGEWLSRRQRRKAA